MRVEAGEGVHAVVEKDGRRLKSGPPGVRRAPEYAEIREQREQVLAQFERIRQRLELAMAAAPHRPRSPPALNRLFREVYLPTAAEGESREVYRLEGRTVYAGALLPRLAKRGWQTACDGFLQRRFPGRIEAHLDFSDWDVYAGSTEILTVGELRIHLPDPAGPSGLDPLVFSEALEQGEHIGRCSGRTNERKRSPLTDNTPRTKLEETAYATT